MDLSKVKEKISGIPAKIKGIFTGLLSIKFPHLKVQAFDFSKLPEKVKAVFTDPGSFVNRLIDRIPAERKRPVLIGLGGLFGLLLILLIVIHAVKPGRQRDNSLQAAARGLVIPQEELFIPEEPDFIPEFILEREPRRYWSLEDIRHYWRAPEKNERWREEIKSAVDKLMEVVP